MQNSIRIETVKSLLELLVITIVGGGVVLIFKSFELSRAQTKIKIEIWKEYLKRIGVAYRDVKRARRTLTAGGLTVKYGNDTTLINADLAELYINQMGIINNVQLELEALKIEAKNLPEFFALAGISEHLKKAEDYLRQILKEYEAVLPRLKSDVPVEFNELERLQEFTTSEGDPFKFSEINPEKSLYRFKTHFADSYRNILEIFKEAFKLDDK